LRRYKEDVSSHFEKTATLFNEVTGSYRNLYEHLADGSQRLGLGPDAHLLQTSPERRRLDGGSGKEESVATAAGTGSAAQACQTEAVTTEQESSEQVSAAEGAEGYSGGTEQEREATREEDKHDGSEAESAKHSETSGDSAGQSEKTADVAEDAEEGEKQAESGAGDEREADQRPEGEAEAEAEEPRQPSDYAPDAKPESEPGKRKPEEA
jgi:uncharacterized protein